MVEWKGERGEARRNANADFSSMNISASQNPEAGFQYSGIHFRFFIRGGIFAAGVRSLPIAATGSWGEE